MPTTATSGGRETQGIPSAAPHNPELSIMPTDRQSPKFVLGFVVVDRDRTVTEKHQ
jgi:hypothetical protein